MISKFGHIVTSAAFIALTATAGALAQDAATTPAPAPQAAPAASPAPQAAMPTTFHLEVDVQDLQNISIALNELPKKIADPLIIKLNNQISAQTAKAAEKK